MPIIGRRGGAVNGSIDARHLTLITVAVASLVRGHSQGPVNAGTSSIWQECKVPFFDYEYQWRVGTSAYGALARPE
jgi:hypothetical protein